MSISAQDFFESKKSQFGAEAQHSLFLSNFITAVNRATDEYAHKTDVAEPEHIDDLEDIIDVDAHHEYALSAGVDMWLIMLGHRNGEMTVKEATDAWDAALRSVRSGRDLAQGRASSTAQVFGMITTK